MKNEQNVVEYMQRLGSMADLLDQMLKQSSLSVRELMTIAYIKGYLSQAKAHIKIQF